ncbi:MAG TPA: sigma-70 family RNA polymerase sigma factor [Dongiaceae bacterium]|jgi:RNA polymerase sigma factor (sigma-70 family)|nr:sigma-70 family RNA polymerase sigma factor [Dongiaceae bacterium]
MSPSNPCIIYYDTSFASSDRLFIYFLFANSGVNLHYLPMAQLTDELIPTRTTLLERLKDWGDDSSWRDFFDIYWKLIYGVAVKGGLTKEEAQDVVQETMLTVAKQMPDFKYDRKAGSFKSWLLNTTRWRIADQFHKREALAISHSSSNDGDTGTRTAEKVIDPASQDMNMLWDAEWERNLLEAAIIKVKRRLDPQKYQIFDFSVNKEWPPEKIAEAFSIPIAQVYLAKHRATAMIKEEVEKMNAETN